MVGEGTYLIVLHLLRLSADSLDNVMTFLLLVYILAIGQLLLLTVSLQGGQTDLSILVNIV